MKKKKQDRRLAWFTSGATELPAVTLDSYNMEVRDAKGFIGDRASNRAFSDILEEMRKAMREVGDDPLGDKPTADMKKKAIDRFLLEGSLEAAGVVQGAIEEFAQELATVIRRFLKEEGWRRTQRIVVGGGLRDSRVGELAIGRTTAILKVEGKAIELVAIRNHPDKAGLIGVAHLVPPAMFSGHDAVLAVDIGGSNIRAGVLKLPKRRPLRLEKVTVWRMEHWRHADADPKPTRDEAVTRLAKMLKSLMDQAEKAGLKLVPFIGVGCPGSIEPDGSISQGGQNLPGNWESGRFNLAGELRDKIPRIGKEETGVVLHNDAVVQGLSEAPHMTDVSRWGVLTIGTGLGNARFTNREIEAANPPARVKGKKRSG